MLQLPEYKYINLLKKRLAKPYRINTHWISFNEKAFDMSAIQSPNSSGEPEWFSLVREKVEGLRFGVVQIVVHDRKVTQIERTEKTRLDGVQAETSSHRELR